MKKNSNQCYSIKTVKNGHWTLEKLQEEVIKYETRGDFRVGNKSVYHVAKKNGLLDELFKNQSNQGYSTKQVKSDFWTLENLQKEVDKYETRMDFQKGNRSMYITTYNKNLLDELFKNHPNQGYPSEQLKPIFWTKEKLQEEVDKYETRGDFYKGNSNAYSYAQKNGLLDGLFKNHSCLGFNLEVCDGATRFIKPKSK